MKILGIDPGIHGGLAIIDVINGAGGNDALASAGKRKAAYALDAGSDPGPIPECPRRDRVS